MNSLASLEAYK